MRRVWGLQRLDRCATNLATGVGNAWLDRSPMIAITCNLNTDQLGRRIQMYIDHHQLFAPITKAPPLREGSVAETVIEAVAIAMSEREGSSIDLPEDVALAPATESIPEIPLPGRISPADAAIDTGHEILNAATRPVALIGSSAMRMAKSGSVAKLCRTPRNSIRHDDNG